MRHAPDVPLTARCWFIRPFPPSIPPSIVPFILWSEIAFIVARGDLANLRRIGPPFLYPRLNIMGTGSNNSVAAESQQQQRHSANAFDLCLFVPFFFSLAFVPQRFPRTRRTRRWVHCSLPAKPKGGGARKGPWEPSRCQRSQITQKARFQASGRPALTLSVLCSLISSLMCTAICWKPVCD